MQKLWNSGSKLCDVPVFFKNGCLLQKTSLDGLAFGLRMKPPTTGTIQPLAMMAYSSIT
jgi:hypothetical protein